LLERCLLIKDMDVRYDDEHRTVIIDNRVLRFSPTEYKLMRLLLTHNVVKGIILREALSLQETDDAAPKLITKYMNKIRTKLTAYDVSINRVHSYGYMLLAIQANNTVLPKVHA